MRAVGPGFHHSLLPRHFRVHHVAIDCDHDVISHTHVSGGPEVSIVTDVEEMFP